MANLSVRGVAEESLRRIKRDAKRRGVSVNRLITDLLNAESGIAPGPRKAHIHNDLDKLSGTWSAAEAREFDAAVSTMRQIDEGLWR